MSQENGVLPVGGMGRCGAGIQGPFSSETQRDDKAKELRSGSDEHGVFPLDVKDGKLDEISDDVKEIKDKDKEP